jgi:hypothetical protein
VLLKFVFEVTRIRGNSGEYAQMKDNIKISSEKIGCEHLNWIQLALETSMEGFCQHSDVSSGSIQIGHFMAG